MESLGLQAFTNVALHRAMFPRGEETREEEQRWRSQRFRTNLQNPNKRFVVAVEETVSDDGTSEEHIIAWAQWASSPSAPEPETTDEGKAKELQERMKSWPDVMDKEAYRNILEGFAELDKQWLAGDDPRNYWGKIMFRSAISRALMLIPRSPRRPCRAPAPPAERTWLQVNQMGHRRSC